MEQQAEYPRWRWSRRTLVRVGIGAVVVGSLAVLSAPAEAAAGNGYGYVWANDAASPIGVAYTPSLSYEYHSSSAQTTITRLDNGSCAVHYPNLSAYGGTALVTAYGATDDRCKISWWGGSSTDTTLYLKCFTRTGSPVNSRFTASFTNPGGGVARAAYLWNDQPWAALDTTFTPSLSYQYNSQGSPNKIVHSATGQYIVRLTGLATAGTTARQIQVTAYGAPSGDPSAYCYVDSSPITDGADALYYVGCLSASQTPIDSGFVLTYVESGNHLLAPVSSHPTASVGVACNPPSWGGACSFSWPFDTNPSADITVETISAGQYAVHLPISLSGGNVQLTGYYLGNTTRGRCSIAYWNSYSGVRVNCYDTNGAAPADATTFMLGFVS